MERTLVITTALGLACVLTCVLPAGAAQSNLAQVPVSPSMGNTAGMNSDPGSMGNMPAMKMDPGSMGNMPGMKMDPGSMGNTAGMNADPGSTGNTAGMNADPGSTGNTAGMKMDTSATGNTMGDVPPLKGAASTGPAAKNGAPDWGQVNPNLPPLTLPDLQKLAQQNNPTLIQAMAQDFEFIANNPGDWIFHCHMVHHMMNHMVRQVGPRIRGMTNTMEYSQAFPNAPDAKDVLGQEGFKVPGFPQGMGMAGMMMSDAMTAESIAKYNARRETFGMRKDWYSGVDGLMTVLRVLPEDLYQKVMETSSHIEPGEIFEAIARRRL